MLNDCKPSGTSSLVAGTSSGIHAWFGKYYIRRIRLAKNDALYQFLSEKLPADLVEDDVFDVNETGIISIPIAAPQNAILRDESVRDLLERTKRFNTEWVAGGHVKGPNKNNVSVTISLKDDQWDEVGDWMWKNNDTFTGMSVLPYDGGTYPQLPFEDIDKTTYDRLCGLLEGVDIDLDNLIETADNTDLAGEQACAGGACEISRV